MGQHVPSAEGGATAVVTGAGLVTGSDPGPGAGGPGMGQYSSMVMSEKTGLIGTGWVGLGIKCSSCAPAFLVHGLASLHNLQCRAEH